MVGWRYVKEKSIRGGAHMKTGTMRILFVIQLVLILLIGKWISPGGYDKDSTELLRETSPDGRYVLLIEEFGESVLSKSYIIEVTLYENNNSFECYSTSFQVDVHTGGGSVHCGIEWLDDGVQIILSGSESDYFILPFKTSVESRVNQTAAVPAVGLWDSHVRRNKYEAKNLENAACHRIYGDLTIVFVDFLVYQI